MMHELQSKVGVRQQGRVSGSGRVLKASSLQARLRVMWRGQRAPRLKKRVANVKRECADITIHWFC